MTPSELLELAGIVEPDKKWLAGSSRPFYEAPGTYDFDEVYFDPSLTGEDWQVAQACRVIVAAASLPTFKAIHKNTQGNFVVERRVDNYPEWDGYTPDIFEASAKALIASRGKG